jgi:hypothetical protein
LCLKKPATKEQINPTQQKELGKTKNRKTENSQNQEFDFPKSSTKFKKF